MLFQKSPTASFHEFKENGGVVKPGDGHAALLELRDRAAAMPNVSRHLEAAASNIPGAASLFDSSVRLSTFEGFDSADVCYPMIADIDRDPAEVVRYDVLRPLPAFPDVKEGTDVPGTTEGLIDQIDLGAPYKARRLDVTATEIRADAHGKIARNAVRFGRGAAYTLEKLVFDYLRDTSNYTRTATDNGIGANHSTSVFSMNNLQEGWATIVSSYETESDTPGQYAPNMILCAPLVFERASRLANSMVLSGGNRDLGMKNPWGDGMFRLKVTNLLEEGEWILTDTKAMGLKMRIAQDFVLSDGGDYSMAMSLSRIYTGSVAASCAFLDDRAWYFANAAS